MTYYFEAWALTQFTVNLPLLVYENPLTLYNKILF